MKKKFDFVFGYRVVFALLAWFGVLGNIVNGVSNRDPGWSVLRRIVLSLSYYTNQTNFLVALWLTLTVIYWQRESQHSFLRPKIKGALMGYITVTFLIYAGFLAQRSNPEGIDQVLNIITHYIVPIAFVLDGFLFDAKQTLEWRYAVDWLVYPFGYLAYALIYGTLTGDYLYFFIDLPELGWSGVVRNVFMLTLFFLMLGSIYIGINRKSKQKAEIA